MARHRPSKQERAGKRSTKAAPLADTPAMPTDFRAGLVVFALLELGTWLVLSLAKGSWFFRPGVSAWRNGFLAGTVLILAGLILLWRAGSKGLRPGRMMVFSILWLVLVVARLVPLFIVGGSGVPVLLTLCVVQFAFGLMIPAAANERRRAVTTAT